MFLCLYPRFHVRYPDPLPGFAKALSRGELVSEGQKVVVEDLDPGHRHFSGMHWLYPAVFGVYGGEKGKSIALAADATIRKKIERDGESTYLLF